MQRLKILYSDDCLVAVDKPALYFTHPPEDKELRMLPRWNALGILEKQLEQKLFPVHRLDRSTSGVLLYARSASVARKLRSTWDDHNVIKSYVCCVRGKPRESTWSCTRALSLKTGGEQQADTSFATLYSCYMPASDSPNGQRAVSLLLAQPTTGRFHQIRRHLAGESLPIFGDKRHGDKKANRGAAAWILPNYLFLRAVKLELPHPETGIPLKIYAPWNRAWHRLLDSLGYCPSTSLLG